ncbi:MAG: DUF1566 domain-containing protein [Polaribacter sp.]|nr:DUF1566 domain-containing protein [Polaribacter sp.]
MKKILLITILLFLSLMTFSQTPEKMSYQAIVRNSDGSLLSEKVVGIRISVLKNATSGASVYTETHTIQTNVNGLVSLEIGTGTVVSGVFSSIDWSNDSYFIKTETDIEGATNYTISGTSQLLSVPYALHAKTAANVFTYKVGDFAHGGIVFWVDETGQHGLVCSKVNQSTGIRWFAGTFGNTQAKRNGLYGGKANNSIIISSHVAIGDDSNSYAARLCSELQVVENNVTYGDWYLPSTFELKLLSQNATVVNSTAISNGGESLINNFYWSSTENTNSRAWIVNISDAQESNVLKSSQNPVRAIRSF